MIRRLLIVAAALLLVLGVAIAILGVRSYRIGDSFFTRTHAGNFSLEIGRGRIWLAWSESDEKNVGLSHDSYRPAHSILTYGRAGQWGFWLDAQPRSDGGGRFSMVLPIWPIPTVLLLLPLGLTMRRARRNLRRKAGLCLTCGYDVRASIGHCPECGETIPA